MRLQTNSGIDLELVQRTLPSLPTVREEFSEIIYVSNTFLGLGVTMDDLVDWHADAQVDLHAIEWVTDRQNAPRSKVLEGYLAQDGFNNDHTEATLHTQCAIIYEVPPYESNLRNSIIDALLNPLLPNSLQEIKPGYPQDIEKDIAKQRYKSYIAEHGNITVNQLEKEAAKWDINIEGKSKEEIQKNIEWQHIKSNSTS